MDLPEEDLLFFFDKLEAFEEGCWDLAVSLALEEEVMAQRQEEEENRLEELKG